MKRTALFLIVLIMAPVFLAAAENGGTEAFSQLRNGQLSGLEVPAFPVPKAAPVSDVRPWSAAVEKSADGDGLLCCPDGATCARVRDSGFSALGVKAEDLASYASSLQAFRALTRGKWYVTFPDGKPLTDGNVGSMFITRKSLIGAYQFRVESMSAQISWNADPALGFGPGSNTVAIKQLCFSPGKLVVSLPMGFNVEVGVSPRRVVIQPGPNNGTDKPVQRSAYLISTNFGQYLFSSDGE